MMKTVKPVLLAFGWTASVAAPLVMHWCLATGRLLPLAAAVTAAQVLTIGSVVLPGRRVAVCLAAILMAALVVLGPGTPTGGLAAASGLSHAMVYTALFALFAASLRLGRVALVTGVARRVRGTLDHGMLAYTRGVTVAWCVFFVAQLLASALLFTLAPLPVWSLFVNVLNFPLVIVMFGGEYAVRRLRFRHHPHISMLQTIRTFTRGQAESS